MTTQWLHGQGGKLLGRLETKSNGDVDGYDSSGRWVGRYQASSNTTNKAGGAYMGQGNLLTALIVCDGD